MANSNSPWYHQKDDTTKDSPVPQKDDNVAASITEQDLDDLVNRLSRPTVASRAKRALFWKIDTPLDLGRLNWTKMPLFDDVQRCLWSENGTVKQTCKIRPTVKQWR